MNHSIMEKLVETTGWLQSKGVGKPVAGIVLGSGLATFSREITIEQEIPYRDIPHFPVSTVAGHDGRLIIGRVAGVPVVAMSGRFHGYEGYSGADIIFPIRVFRQLGIRFLLLSNAAGSMNPAFKIGDIMLLTDQISFFVPNPLIGANIEELGPRFPDMSEAYSKRLLSAVRSVAAEKCISYQEGIYAAVTGPTYETAAEYRLLLAAGADAVGMSTVQECIAARHMGMEVFAVSVITDTWSAEAHSTITHEEVLEAAAGAEPRLSALFTGLISKLESFN